MVRHLVRQYRERRNGPQAQVSHKGRCNKYTIAEAVHAVTREHSPTARLRCVVMVMVMGMVARVPVVDMLVVLMAVVPQLGLVQQEKEHQPHQQREKQVVRTRLTFKGLGQQVHEGRGHQRTCSQAQHVLGVARQNAKAQCRGQPHTADTGDQGSDQYCYQSHSYSGIFFPGSRPI